MQSEENHEDNLKLEKKVSGEELILSKNALNMI